MGIRPVHSLLPLCLKSGRPGNGSNALLDRSALQTGNQLSLLGRVPAVRDPTLALFASLLPGQTVCDRCKGGYVQVVVQKNFRDECAFTDMIPDRESRTDLM